MNWKVFIHRWAEDYNFVSSNRTSTFIEPRGLNAFLNNLREYDQQYAVTGTLAAATVAPVAVARLAVVYMTDVPLAVQQLGLRRAETGANVMLAEGYDPVAFERTSERDSITYTAFSQVAVDLLTGPGRGQAEAENSATGTIMAVRATSGQEDPDEISTSCILLANDLLDELESP